MGPTLAPRNCWSKSTGLVSLSPRAEGEWRHESSEALRAGLTAEQAAAVARMDAQQLIATARLFARKRL